SKRWVFNNVTTFVVFKIQAEPDTDEIYAQVMLVPESEENAAAKDPLPQP
ncbi:Auxin response factor 2B, partial [Bienertia sinuspersici]